MKKDIDQKIGRSGSGRGVKVLFFGLAVVFSVLSAVAEMRVWEEKSGKRFVAEYVREISGRVTLRTLGKTPLFIPVRDLSDRDVNYLRTFVLPEIQVGIRKRDRPKERNYDFVKSGDIMSVLTLEVRVENVGRTSYSGKLMSEVYLIGQEIATDDYRLCAKKTSPIEFTEENKGLFMFSASADIRQYTEYNSQERGAEYKGYLVLVLDPQGNIMETKCDLNWLEEDKVDSLRKLRVNSFFNEQCRKRRVPRPVIFEDRAEW